MSGEQKVATIIIGDSRALAIFTQMLEKHEKGTIATKNTVEAFGGDPHAMDGVLAHIGQWRRQTALQTDLLAPKGDDAAKGTPLGDALSEAQTHDGAAIVFAPWVPRPRPSVGQLVRWPGNTATSITKVIGFRHAELQGDERPDMSVSADFADRLHDDGYFEVVDAEGWQGFVQSHFDNVSAAIEWRTLETEAYASPRVIPVRTLEEALAEALAVDGKADDGAAGDADVVEVSAGAREAFAAAEDAMAAVSTPAGKGKKARKGKTTDATPAPVSVQRERNARAAGVVRSVPKPKVGGGKRTGRKGGR